MNGAEQREIPRGYASDYTDGLAAYFNAALLRVGVNLGGGLDGDGLLA